MGRIKSVLTNRRTLAVIGIVAILIVVLLVAQTWRGALLALETLIILGLVAWLLLRLWQRRRARKASEQMSNELEAEAADAVARSDSGKREEIAELRNRMQSALRTIKSSKIGHKSGRTALYELPWYMVIGNPAAGKSTAIVNSGLQFPLANEAGEGRIIQGIGGTRNCDWFFTSEGILVDTAGRFSVHSEDRKEWLGLVDLLKKHRPKAPLNGIIIAASISDLTERGPDFSVNLAQKLRQRVQELTERLEIFAPIYVLFTKADLIAGFNDFFADADAGERSRVWGVSMPYSTTGNQAAVAAFDARFDELHRGLQEMSKAQMAQHGSRKMPPGIFTFPLEFAAIKPAVRAFLTTLFEENPYQFNPVFRGFYFTSAVQEGQPIEQSGERIAQRFKLTSSTHPTPAEGVEGFFLADLFRRVIFADSGLVRQYNSRSKIRTRYAVLFSAAAILGLLFAGWAWSYSSNRELVRSVLSDMQKVVSVQHNQTDLASRFDALSILQQRIEQLTHYSNDKPLSLGLGLYHGAPLLHKLKQEYYHGVRTLMLEPVARELEAYLGQVNDNADKLQRDPAADPGGDTSHADGDTTYRRNDPTDVKEGYNALKTYLMLSDKSHIDVKHLYDQITRFWRGWLEANRGGMPREKMIRNAEQVITFYLGHVNDPDWPTIDDSLTLVANTREHLRHVMSGLPARQRVYAEIKARASTRFAPVTVAAMLDGADGTDAEQDGNGDGTALIGGSYAVSGTFSRQAWQNYIQGAIEKAATQELQTDDWVLRSSSRDDLTLQGSPEQIKQQLTRKYKSEYAAEWRKFIQGLTIKPFNSFEAAVHGLNQLGNPQHSPMRRLLVGIYRQTAWDQPSSPKPDDDASSEQGSSSNFIVDWFKRVILRRTPHQVNRAAYYVDTDDIKQSVSGAGNAGAGHTQPIASQLSDQFSGVANLVQEQDGQSLLNGYLKTLAAIRTRLNTINNQGSIGSGTLKLMRQTLGDGDSELAHSLQYVEQQMLPAMPKDQRAVLRPVLVRPLIQTMAAMVGPSQEEINAQWQAKIYDSYQQTLANKYPFAPQASVEASGDAIARIFGPDGKIAEFANDNLDNLVIRRGRTITPRTWADIGLSLTPVFTQHFPQWVANLDAQGIPSMSNKAGDTAQTVFQIRPQPASGVRQYTLVLDGQKLTYRNTQSQWANFIWPNPKGTPGVKLSATTFDGHDIQIFDFPGRYGLRKLIDSAASKRLGQNVFNLSWNQDGIDITVNLRIISTSSSNQSAGIDALRLPARIVGSGGNRERSRTADKAQDEDTDTEQVKEAS